ncbi:MAG: MopE-related protein [Pseudomonadota bacterium]|nr:MopE-related protein [Pseudomonadota bacterium]
MILLLAACARDTPQGDEAPHLSFADPSWGDVLTGTAGVLVTSSGSGSVAVDVEGEPLGEGAAPLSLAWDTTTALDGNHRLSAVSGAGAEGAGAEGAVDVWVRNGERDLDDVRFVQPSDGATVCGTMVVEAFVAEDTEEVTFLLDGAEQGTASAAPWRWEWSTTPGAHRLRARARFADGAVAQRTIGVTGAEDGCSPSPRVTITSPSAEAWTAEGLTLAAEVDAGLHEVAWFVDDGLYARVTEAPWSVAWDTSAFVEGAHRIRAVASTPEAEGRAEVRVGIDRTPPTVGDVTPVEGAVVSGTVTLGAAVNDEQGVGSVVVSVDGAILCSFEAGPYACAWETGGSPAGAHVVGWSVVDRAGNRAEASATVTVDNPPEVVWLAPSEGETVSGEVRLEVAFEDDEGVAATQLLVDGATVDAAWDTCTETLGAHTLTAEAVDAGGQVTSASIDVVVDQPFEIALVADTVLVPGSLLGAWSTNDHAVARVDWDIDGVRVASTLSSVPTGDGADPGCGLDCPALCLAWSGVAALSGVADGPGVLTATAVDATGAVASATAAVEVLLDADRDGYVTVLGGGDDCDDASADVHPGATEACDGTDQDCDGAADEDFDADADGHLDADACADGDDCDDTDATVSPSAATDACDGRDEDCDGWIDYGSTPGGGTATFGGGGATLTVEDDLFGNVVTVDTDSLLTDLAMYLDPSGSTDTTLVVFESTGLSVWSRAATAELVGDGTAGWYAAEGLEIPLLSSRSYLLAVEVDGLSEVYLDPAAALASDAGVSPAGAIQASSAGGALGDDPLLADPDPARLAWQLVTVAVIDAEDRDADGDGVSARCGDCDDDDADVLPGAVEACDGEDGDCSGSASDEADADADGYRLCDADCDDADAAAWPGAVEACDGVDQDCDGSATGEEDADADGVRVCEADCDDTDPTVGAEAYFADADGDGFGDPATPATECPAPAGYVTDGTDCDDADATVYAGAVEDCDGADDDCDGSVDEGWDADGDGWPACEDCDDAEANVRPDAEEVCGDEVDDDCDGVATRCRLETGGTVASAAAVLVGEDASDYAGYELARGDDLDGDGYADIVLSAVGDDDGGADAGALYVVRGPVVGSLDLSLADAKRSTGTAAWGSYLPLAVGEDLDGDAVPDILFGTPEMTFGGRDAGGAYVWSGDIAGAGDDADSLVTFVGEDTYDYAGQTVAMSDLDGDSVAEALIGSGKSSGYVYVFSAPLSGTLDLSTSDGRFVGEDSGDEAGDGLCRAGDVDGDGLDDLYIGAPGDDDTWFNGGAVYLVLGGSIGTVDLSAAEAKLLGEDSGDGIGRRLAGPGDVNGDGLDDLLVGDSSDGDGGTGAGAAWLVLAPMAGTSSLSAADAKLVGVAASGAGYDVAGPGDLDGDGFAELLVGANSADVGASNAGGAWLLYGPIAGSGDLSDSGVLVSGAASSDAVGTTVAGAGDVDGDGAPDFLLGATGVDTGGSSAGAVYLFGGAF